MKIAALLLALVASEKMTTEVAETSNMHYITNRATRNNACVAAAICANPYCSLYDCYEKNNKPLCAGETKDVRNTPAEAKVGIHHNVKESVVRGWRVRLHERYSAQHGRDMRNVINDWNTHNNWMFIAAQYVGDRGNDYYIGAFAPTRRVFSRCNNSRHCGYRTLPAADCIHGAYWYCVVDWSFGYSAHNQVRLCSADTFGLFGGHSPGQSNNHRLSWHMHYWYTAGWRAGMAHNMNSESNMYKLVFTKVCNGCGATPYPTRYPTRYPTPYPTPFPTPYPTPYPTAYPTRFPTRYPTPYPTPFPTPFPTRYPTPYPTAYPTPAPTGILQHAACKLTTCVYQNGQTVITTERFHNNNQVSGALNAFEPFHCEKVGSGCKCVCHSSLKCALRHHHSTGYKKTFEHC